MWAIRCFLRPISDHAERYDAISKHLQTAKHARTARFMYLVEGIKIRANWFPIVKMEWVQGKLLDRHVEESLKKPDEKDHGRYFGKPPPSPANNPIRNSVG